MQNINWGDFWKKTVLKKLIIFLLIGSVLAPILLSGICQAEEEKEEGEGKKEGYQPTPEDKKIQIISVLILLILAVVL